MIKTNFFLFLFLLNCSIHALAGIRAGNMRVEQLSANTVSLTVNLYSDLHSSPPQLELCWGDGNCEQWATTLVAEQAALDTRHHQMQTFHSYDQQKTFELTVNACCWVKDLKNITAAEDKPFTLRTQFAFSGDDEQLRNTMPLIESPIALCPLAGCGFLPLVSDLESDSLVWELCTPELEGYADLEEVAPSPFNVVIFNNKNGQLSWGSPPFEGLYSYITCIKEYRGDVLLSESEAYTLVVVQKTSSVTEVDLPNFKLSPNPAREVVFLNGLPEEWNNAHCQVFDATGQMIYRQQGRQPLPVGDWNPGFYFLVLEKEGIWTRRKLVVLSH